MRLQVAKAASAELKVSLEELPARVAALLDDRKKLERDLSEAKKRLAMMVAVAQARLPRTTACAASAMSS